MGGLLNTEKQKLESSTGEGLPMCSFTIVQSFPIRVGSKQQLLKPKAGGIPKHVNTVIVTDNC
jgi:hypothetical protein